MKNETKNKEPPRKPEAKFRVGGLTAAIWTHRNTARNGHSFTQRKATLERTYQDAQGAWRQTNSYDVNDLPKAILALHKAYEYLATGTGKDDQDDEGQAPLTETIP